MSSRRGLFIVFEGLDRTGKTTQVQLLRAHLTDTLSLPTIELCFPDRETETGVLIDRFLRKELQFPAETIHLLYTANRWEKNDFMRETLASGTHIVCSRYAYSGVAYTSAKGLDLAWCQYAEIGLPCPDLVIFLYPASEVDLTSREGYGDEVYETVPFQLRVQEQFKQLLAQDQDVVLGDGVWRPVNASRTIEEVQEEILGIVGEMLEREPGPVGTLWENIIPKPNEEEMVE